MKALKKTVRFAKAGFFGFTDLEGQRHTCYLSEEVLNSNISDAEGIPVYLEHNEEGKQYGYVSNVYMSDDGWYNADILITDENMQSVLSTEGNGGYAVSNGYQSKNRTGSFRNNGIDYDQEVTEMFWKELTLTRNPKYKDAVILNSDNCLDSGFIENSQPTEGNEMTKIIVDGVEHDEDYVVEAIKNFEDGKESLISKAVKFFSVKNTEEVKEISEEVEDELSEAPAEEEAKAEAEAKEPEVETEEEVKAEPEVETEEKEEADAKDNSEAEEETKAEVVKNSDDIKAKVLAGVTKEPKAKFVFTEKIR